MHSRLVSRMDGQEYVCNQVDQQHNSINGIASSTYQRHHHGKNRNDQKDDGQNIQSEDEREPIDVTGKRNNRNGKTNTGNGGAQCEIEAGLEFIVSCSIYGGNAFRQQNNG